MSVGDNSMASKAAFEATESSNSKSTSGNVKDSVEISNVFSYPMSVLTSKSEKQKKKQKKRNTTAPGKRTRFRGDMAQGR